MAVVRQYVVHRGTPPRRLDLTLVERGHGLSRAQIQRLIHEGRVTVDGRAVKAGYLLRAGEIVVVEIPEPQPLKLEPEAIPLSILYEDDHLIVVDKPAGMVVHPAAGNWKGTLVHALLHHCPVFSEMGGERPGIVHRLDKGTSGVLVVAKTPQAHEALARQFKAHTVTRKYLALALGDARDAAGTIRTPIGRHVTDRKKMGVRTRKGREAVTHYRVLDRFGDAMLLEVRLETGRTHQVRVHLAHIGHPVLGDRVYGGTRAMQLRGERIERVMLHAAVLGFTHPATVEYLEFTSPPPEVFQDMLEELRNFTPVEWRKRERGS
ncbi:MAG: RluA family pseudouridine synthase [Nitrospirae bacterium]|nr:RluA family pseudouridine synthase [Nitrospirota bacterium]